MIIASGIFDHCVLQRNKNDICDVFVSGYLKYNTPVQVHIPNTSGKKTLIKAPFSILTMTPADSNDDKVENPQHSLRSDCRFKEENPQHSLRSDCRLKKVSHPYAFHTTLKGIPVGGPYEVHFTQQDDVKIFTDILVGDVYLLGGQSNMEGNGRLGDKLKPNPNVRAFYMNDRWAVAEDPLHNLIDAIDPAHEAINGGPFEPRDPAIGVGPRVSFGQHLYELTGVPQGLIACAHGGTTMDQWSPKKKDDSGTTLYTALLRRFHKNGSHVKGLFWHQGCSDANDQDSQTYYDKMVDFVENIRKDIGHTDLPVVAAQISRVCYPTLDAGAWNRVQACQYELGEKLTNFHTVPTIDLELDDFIHLSGASQNRLGIRCAKSMYYLTCDNTGYKPPLSMENAEVVSSGWNGKIIITYKNVIGSLHSKGRASGFSISRTPDTHDGFYIYKTELSGNRVILHTTEIILDLRNYYLHYGQGLHPFCNITDKADRSLPVMTNIPLGDRRYFSLPCTFAWLHPGVRKTVLQDNPARLVNHLKNSFEFRDYGYLFLNVSTMGPDTAGQKQVTYYLPFMAETAGEMDLMIGGYGHVNVYMDDEIIADKSLDSEPVAPDNMSVPVKLAKGIHLLTIEYEIVPKHPKGLFVRFELPDKLAKPPVWLK